MSAENQPLLSDYLTEAQRLALLGLKQHPGFAVLELMLMDACRRTNDSVMKLDPEEEAYERKLKARQAKARERNEFSLLLLRSIDWQTQPAFTAPKQEEKPEPNPIVKGLKQ